LENEIVATALEQLAYLLREYPIPAGILTNTLISNDGGKSPEIAIQFSVLKSTKKLKALEIEISLWRSKNSAAKLNLEAISKETGEVLLQETIDLKHLDDAYPYLEQALNLFNLEKTE
jgi:hypothetical protein